MMGTVQVMCRASRLGEQRPGGPAPSLSNLYAPILEDLTRAKEIFDAELLSEFPFVNDLCDTIRSYRGKMLRPALLLLSGKAAGTVSSCHHVLAAVVEIVHMATLVHDDVIDSADERRRRPTIRRLTGNVGAVLLGDFLISHAFHLCSSLPNRHASRRIGATTNVVCEGELLQNRYAGDVSIDERIYLEIVRRKTGALTAAACELGAYFANAEEAVVSALRDFGENAGIAFQIMDDLLDLAGDEASVGKSLGRDHTTGTLTLPLIHGLARARGETRNLLLECLARETPSDRHRLRTLLHESESLDYALEVAERHVDEARRKLESVPPGDAKTTLSTMADFILQRSF